MVALFSSPIGEAVVQALQDSGQRDLLPAALSYGHGPLLSLVSDLGVRSLELDVVFDPDGGRYGYRAGPKISAALKLADDSAQKGGPELFTPGSKVLHIPDLDFQSTCDSLISCLAPIATWSAANPTHAPLFIAIEIKSWNPESYIGPVQLGLVNSLLRFAPGNPESLASTPAPDVAYLYALQDEILTVFDRSQVFTPDEFRGNYSSLQERIAQSGWPLLEDLRGHVFFRALGSGSYMRLLEETWPGGKGALLFREEYVNGVPYVPGAGTVFASIDWGVNGLPGMLNRTALAEMGVPLDDNAMNDDHRRIVANEYRLAIEQVVKDGKVMLRATGDSGTMQARINFKGFAAAAAAGGAHFVHTDYPAGAVSQCGFTSNYTIYNQQILRGTWNSTTLSATNTTRWYNKTQPVQLATVCNPVTAQPACTTWMAGGQPASSCTCYSLF